MATNQSVCIPKSSITPVEMGKGKQKQPIQPEGAIYMHWRNRLYKDPVQLFMNAIPED